MANIPPPQSSIVPYQTDVRTIHENSVNILEEGANALSKSDLMAAATIRKSRMVRFGGMPSDGTTCKESLQVRQDPNPAFGEAFKEEGQFVPPLGLAVATAGAA